MLYILPEYRKIINCSTPQFDERFVEILTSLYEIIEQFKEVFENANFFLIVGHVNDPLGSSVKLIPTI